MRVTFFTSESGRSQPADFLRSVETSVRHDIAADMETLRLHGTRGPVQVKPIVGARPMMELKTGQYRTFFVRHGDEFTVLHICKKQDQKHGIEVARRRMQEVLEA